MVILPAGSFEMGDNTSFEAELPVRTVSIEHPFALGRCEVTVAEFRRYVEATATDPGADGSACFSLEPETAEYERVSGVSWRAQGFEGQDTLDQHPAVCISWGDAQGYIQWLNTQTGLSDSPNRYRLPSEAEFEYALRSGNQQTYAWGDASQCDYSNAADQSLPDSVKSRWSVAECNDGFPWVAPVGRFPRNPYGLFDVSGNAWEWTEDCWHDNYTGAPTSAVPWLEEDGGDCSRRVLRGGSWFNIPESLRSANRFRNTTVFRFVFVGFRLARTLGPLPSDL